MGFFDLFNKKKHSSEETPSYFEVDFHSHLIPGIDDGSKSYEESIEIMSFCKSIGIRKMITTPHVSLDYFQNKKDDILARFQILKDETAKAGIDMELEVAAEYMIDDGFRLIMNEGKLLTFGKNYLLIELSGFTQHPEFASLVFDLQSSGYNVILAHPERYSFWHHHKEFYTTLKERDILFQINALSLTNIYSTEVNKTAKWLIENKMFDFIGTDIHHAGQKGIFRKALSSKLYSKLCDVKTIRNNEL